MHHIRVGITQGDINGIGPEVVMKALAAEEIFGMAVPVVFGSSDIAASIIKECNLEGVHFTPVKSASEAREGRINIVDVTTVRPTPGVPSRDAGAAAYAALTAACDALDRGDVDILVTAPIDKNSIQRDGFHFHGHTEFLQNRYGKEGDQALMILFTDEMRVALATNHLPIADVASAITPTLIRDKVIALDATLRKDFGCERPKIGVLGLNPHCGDHGLIGSEEETAIIPAISETRDKGLLSFGPYPADGFFGSGNYAKFDGVLAMYHDQGLAPFKSLAGAYGVNFTAGLSIVRTSPDHGTAYDIAGKNMADPTSMRQAIFKGIDIYRNRRNYLEWSENPLKVKREKPDTRKRRAPEISPFSLREDNAKID